jgi:hypothetical protein
VVWGSGQSQSSSPSPAPPSSWQPPLPVTDIEPPPSCQAWGLPRCAGRRGHQPEDLLT